MRKTDYIHQCQHCHKRFKTEKWYMNHSCKGMERERALRTNVGQAAWNYYKDWMRLQRKRVPDDPQTFIKSNYYHSFNRFATMVRKLKLPSEDIFIKMMVDKNYLPTLWTNDEVYINYLRHLDNAVPPKKLVSITVETILELSELFECDTGEIFNYLDGNEVIELVRERKLSPWILLRSSKFLNFVKKLETINKHQFAILNTLMDPGIWKKRFSKHPDVVKWITEEIIPEMRL